MSYIEGSLHDERFVMCCLWCVASHYWTWITRRPDWICWHHAMSIRKVLHCQQAVRWLAVPSVRICSRSRYLCRSCATSIHSRHRCGAKPSVCQRCCTVQTVSWSPRNCDAALPLKHTSATSTENWTRSIAVQHCALDSVTFHRLLQSSRKYQHCVLVIISHPTTVQQNVEQPMLWYRL